MHTKSTRLPMNNMLNPCSMRTNWQQLDALLKNPDVHKVLVSSRGLLVTLQILTSSSFSLEKETHGSLGQCVSFSLIDVGSGFTAYVVFLFFYFFLLIMSRLAVALFDWRPYSCNPCNPCWGWTFEKGYNKLGLLVTSKPSKKKFVLSKDWGGALHHISTSEAARYNNRNAGVLGKSNLLMYLCVYNHFCIRAPGMNMLLVLDSIQIIDTLKLSHG